jgi:DNA-binding NtrC family response regulator
MDNKTEAHASVAIVEDERISRKALAALLSDQGYETTAFASAEEMLDSVDRELPKVLLVDVDLPGMSGLQLLTLLEQRFPDVRAVLITAADGEDVKRFCREHPVAYMRKPLNLQQLLSLLSQRQLCH